MTRTEAREQAFILVFEKIFHSDETIHEIIENAEAGRELQVDEFAKKAAVSIAEKQTELDILIEKYSQKWKISRLSKVNLALLRLAVYEMAFDDSIPVSVSINEAVELCKKYGGEDDYTYLNGVLGSYAKDLEAAKK